MAKKPTDSPDKPARKAEQRPYKQVARAQAQQRTRDALLDAASEELSKAGSSKASLETVAAKAGVTKQTALRHFGSKDGLIDAAFRRLSEGVRKERGAAPVGDVPGAARNLMEHYERYGDMMMRLLGEGHLFYLLRRATDHGRQVHVEWVKRTFAPQLESLRGAERERRTAQLVAVCDVYVWKLLRRDMKLSARQAEIALVELIEGLE
ncbi:MAG: TetR/AcrR family transcriptional regulator [Solirubrobacteraceae bacterium]